MSFISPNRPQDDEHATTPGHADHQPAGTDDRPGAVVRMGLPDPARPGSGRSRKFPWDSMQPGEAYVTEDKDEYTRASSSARLYEKREYRPEVRFIARTFREGNRIKYGIFCVRPEDVEVGEE